MKKKILIISLFTVFALPIPVAMLGCLLTTIWFLASLIKVTSFVEIISALIGVLIGATYIISYIFALNKTCLKDKNFEYKSHYGSIDLWKYHRKHILFTTVYDEQVIEYFKLKGISVIGEIQ